MLLMYTGISSQYNRKARASFPKSLKPPNGLKHIKYTDHHDNHCSFYAEDQFWTNRLLRNWPQFI